MAVKKKTKKKRTAKKPIKKTTAKKVQVHEKKLYRSKSNRILGGVCGGIGEYLEVDPVLIRLIWILATLIYGAGLLAYLLFWIVIPEKK